MGASRVVSLAEARREAPGTLVDTAMGTVHAVVRGTGPALVLLHGVTASVAVWTALQAEFSGEATVHAVDLAGHGLTDIPREPWTVARMADGVAAYLDAAGVDRAVVVGSSMGGGVALGLAARQPERVSSLVLLGSIGLGFPRPFGLSLLRLPLAAECARFTAVNPPLRRMFSREIFHPDFTPDDGFLARMWQPFLVRERARYLRALLRQIDVAEPTPWLPSIRARTHVVHGDADRLVPLSVGQGLARTLANTSLYVLGRTGHYPHLERPAETAAVLRDALAGH